MHRPVLLLAFLLTFSGCNGQKVSVGQEECASITQPIIAEIPTGTVDLADSYPPSSTAEALTVHSVGTFVGEHTLLTVAHALPNVARIAGMSEIKRDKEAHLLLLNTDICGNGIRIAANDLQRGNTVFDCESGTDKGKISDLETAIFSESPLSFIAFPLNGLAVLPGAFTEGDSGLPFCNQNGELLGILAAVRENYALLIPAQQIRPFLN